MKFLASLKRDILAVVWMAVALFLALALFSYYPKDPSFNFKAGKLVEIKNLCGFLGSFISDILYQLFGLGSWIIVALVVGLAVKTLFSQSNTKWNKVFLGALFIVQISALLSLHFPKSVFFDGEIPAGGVIGHLYFKGASSVLNTVGAGVFLWALTISFLILITERPLKQFLVFPNKRVFLVVPGLFWLSVATALHALKKLMPKPKAKREEVARQSEDQAPARFALKSEDTIENETASGPPEPLKERLINVFKEIKPQRGSFIPKVVRIENWELPTVELLNVPQKEGKKVDERELHKNARLVEQKLAEFDVTGEVVEVKPGPAVTMYEFKPAASIKINDITKLSDDLSLALSAESIRIIAPIPGRDVVGIETSNSKRAAICMRELVEDENFWSQDLKLPIALGKNVSGQSTIIDLRKIPHLLVAGTTGSGKSVFITALVTSLIMRHSPKTLRLVLIDPKQVDLASFHKVPHLLMPPIKEARGAVNTLKWLIKEMEKRYRSMSRFGSRSLESFNEAALNLDEAKKAEHEERVRELNANPKTCHEDYYYEPQPYIVAVIEEFADLMSVDRGGVEQAVVRLAQMARASGIHLVVAMQSPRREVLTGLIKTNFPGRISFKVASKVDSSIILDQKGAERLLSVGDMLYLAPGLSQPQRYHGAFLKDDEISRISEFWMTQGDPIFESSAVDFVNNEGDTASFDGPSDEEYEEGYDQVVAYASSQKEISASLIQRRFRFGYPKAARIIEKMESEGVIGPANGSKPRQVLINRLD